MTPLSIKSLYTSSLLLLSIIPNMAAGVQTCKDYIPDLNPDSRYTDNGNSTITDKSTGLVWKQCVEGLSGATCTAGTATTYTWDGALQLATMVNLVTFAGYADWRVPNLTELESLVTQNCINPSINISLFPSDPVSFVWSSSPLEDRSSIAWIIGFDYGEIGHGIRFYSYDVNRGGNRYVRLVRSGQ